MIKVNRKHVIIKNYIKLQSLPLAIHTETVVCPLFLSIKEPVFIEYK